MTKYREPKYKNLLVALVAVVALLAAGCGDDSSEGPAVDAAPASDASEAAPSSTETAEDVTGQDAAEEPEGEAVVEDAAEEPEGEAVVEDAAEEPEGETTDEVPADDRYGGTIIVSTAGSIEHMGPFNWGGPGYLGAMNIFDRLYDLAPDGSGIEPMLAESLPESTDGKLWRFILVDGVTFHNGAPLTANDVKYSIERQLVPDNGFSAHGQWKSFNFIGQDDFVAGTAAEVSGIRVIDELTLEIELVNAQSSLPFWLSMPMNGIVPAEYASSLSVIEFDQAPIGTGPFRLTSYDADSGATLERFEDYWREGQPYVDAVEIQFNVDSELAIQRILAGEQDLAYGPVPAGQVLQVRGDDRYAEATLSDVLFITASFDHPALAQVEVRQAVSLAIDREKVVRQLGGVGSPATGGIFSPQSPYWQGGFEYTTYDPDRARQLLADAGYTDGFDVTIYSRQTSPHETIGQSVAADLEAIGINVELRTDPVGTWVEDYVRAHPPGLGVARYELAYPHGSYVIDSAFLTALIDGSCCNFGDYNNPDMDVLAATARSSTDIGEQARVYKEIDAIAVGLDLAWIPVIYPVHPSLRSERMNGYVPTSSPEGSIMRFADLWLTE